jgi:hypothetical protein
MQGLRSGVPWVFTRCATEAQRADALDGRGPKLPYTRHTDPLSLQLREWPLGRGGCLMGPLRTFVPQEWKALGSSS